MRKLKFIYYVEDEDKNIICEKRQCIIELSDEDIANAQKLPDLKNYPDTNQGMAQWAKDAGTWNAIGEMFRAGEIVCWRDARMQMIKWAINQKQKEET